MEQLLLVTSSDSSAGIGVSLRTHGTTEGRTDVKVEIVNRFHHRKLVIYITISTFPSVRPCLRHTTALHHVNSSRGQNVTNNSCYVRMPQWCQKYIRGHPLIPRVTRGGPRGSTANFIESRNFAYKSC